MNLEDPAETPLLAVFSAIEKAARARGGDVVETQVIGMIPDALVLPAAQGRLHILDLEPAPRFVPPCPGCTCKGARDTRTPTSDDAI